MAFVFLAGFSLPRSSTLFTFYSFWHEARSRVSRVLLFLSARRLKFITSALCCEKTSLVDKPALTICNQSTKADLGCFERTQKLRKHFGTGSTLAICILRLILTGEILRRLYTAGISKCLSSFGLSLEVYYLHFNGLQQMRWIVFCVDGAAAKILIAFNRCGVLLCDAGWLEQSTAWMFNV